MDVGELKTYLGVFLLMVVKKTPTPNLIGPRPRRFCSAPNKLQNGLNTLQANNMMFTCHNSEIDKVNLFYDKVGK